MADAVKMGLVFPPEILLKLKRIVAEGLYCIKVGAQATITCTPLLQDGWQVEDWVMFTQLLHQTVLMVGAMDLELDGNWRHEAALL